MSPYKSKRNALANKQVNVQNSIHKQQANKFPLKNSKVELDFALKRSPIRECRNDDSPILSKSVSNSPSKFTFFVETEEQRTATLIDHMSLQTLKPVVNDENDYEYIKENMSPRKIKILNENKVKKSSERIPLKELSIDQYKGFIENPQTQESLPLTLHLTRKTFLPSFVTPPRDSKIKSQFTSNSNEEVQILRSSRSTDDINNNHNTIRKLDFTIYQD